MHAVWFCLLMVLGSSLAARILSIYPTPSISHQLPMQTMLKALAWHGHNVTVLSPDPLKVPHPNYTDIDLSFTYDYWRAKHNLNSLEDMNPYGLMEIFGEMGVEIAQLQLGSDAVQEFIKSEPKFDLVIIECLMYHAYYGLIHHVGSPPVIGLLSFGALPPNLDQMGNPNHPAYDPHTMLSYDDHMGFWQRVNNMVYGIWMRYYWYWVLVPAQEKIMRQYFGDGPPAISLSDKNYSLLMLNNHWSMSYPRPNLPSVIELGNLHLQTKTKPLPQDLQHFLDGATDGFIYFSLGSNIRSDMLPPDKVQEILKAFSQLPQRVVWKWESDALPGQPDNVKLGKWLPQQDILAHPNIRVFITQGGLQSLGEATHNAVPLIGIPFIGDQRYNVRKVVTAGIGLKMDFQDLTTDLILDTINAVIHDPKYRENMQKFSAINKDQPDQPLDRAVWWTEYVLRHNGAKHLRSAALDLTWYQYLLLDVVAAIVTALLLATIIVYYCARKLCRCICKLLAKTKVE